jgi:hypothetical protein
MVSELKVRRIQHVLFCWWKSRSDAFHRLIGEMLATPNSQLTHILIMGMTTSSASGTEAVGESAEGQSPVEVTPRRLWVIKVVRREAIVSLNLTTPTHSSTLNNFAPPTRSVHSASCSRRSTVSLPLPLWTVQPPLQLPCLTHQQQHPSTTLTLQLRTNASSA